MPPSTCCRKAKTSAGALLMKVCILSTKCSKWKAALNSTLSVNLRWVWWKHSRCILFPGITCFVNTFHGSFKSWICFNKFQPPKKRWSSTIYGQKKHKQTNERHPKESSTRLLCSWSCACCIFFSNGWGEMTVSVWFLFPSSPFSRWNHPNTNKDVKWQTLGFFCWGVSFNSD